MLHKNATALLRQHGAVVIEGTVSLRNEAELNGHKLEWGFDGWTKRIKEVEYFAPGGGRPKNYMLTTKHVANGTLVKRFIELAAAVAWTDGGVAVAYGPDATHPKLAPSLRAWHLGWSGPNCNVRSKEALAFGESWKAGEGVPGIILDWLREVGHLAEVA